MSQKSITWKNCQNNDYIDQFVLNNKDTFLYKGQSNPMI